MKGSRRSFVNVLLGTSFGALLGSILYPIAKFLLPPKTVEAQPGSVVAGTVGEFKPNSGKIIKFGTKPVIVLETPGGEIRAFSAVCTHLGCTVQYREDLGHIWCACHNGHYDLNGINIAGPPPRPLPPFDVKIKDDKVFVSRRVLAAADRMRKKWLGSWFASKKT